MFDKKHPPGEAPAYPYYDDEGIDRTVISGGRHVAGERDVFGDEENHQIKYKTLSWQLVAVLMIAEIVSNGMLSLPSSGGVVGVSPAANKIQIERYLIMFSGQLIPNVILIVVRTGTDNSAVAVLISAYCSFWESLALSPLISWFNCE